MQTDGNSGEFNRLIDLTLEDESHNDVIIIDDDENSINSDVEYVHSNFYSSHDNSLNNQQNDFYTQDRSYVCRDKSSCLRSKKVLSPIDFTSPPPLIDGHNIQCSLASNVVSYSSELSSNDVPMVNDFISNQQQGTLSTPSVSTDVSNINDMHLFTPGLPPLLYANLSHSRVSSPVHSESTRYPITNDSQEQDVTVTDHSLLNNLSTNLPTLESETFQSADSNTPESLEIEKENHTVSKNSRNTNSVTRNTLSTNESSQNWQNLSNDCNKILSDNNEFSEDERIKINTLKVFPLKSTVSVLDKIIDNKSIDPPSQSNPVLTIQKFEDAGIEVFSESITSSVRLDSDKTNASSTVVTSDEIATTSNEVAYSSCIHSNTLKMSFRKVPKAANSSIDQTGLLPFNEYFYSHENTAKEITKSKKRVLIQCPICKIATSNSTFLFHFIRHYKSSFVREKCNNRIIHRCRDCLKTFHSAYSLHSHISRKSKTRKKPLSFRRECAICELDFSTDLELANHFKQTRHPARDMPYCCPVCYNYRTSIYYDFVRHFAETHGNTAHIYCPYCLKLFSVIENSYKSCYNLATVPHQFVRHLNNHFFGRNASCSQCRLMFLKSQSVKCHKFLHHTGKNFTVEDPHKTLQPVIKTISLNVECSSPVENQSLRKLKANLPRGSNHCMECGDSFVSFRKHFVKIRKCGLCQYTSACNYGFNRHYRAYHHKNRQTSSLTKFRPTIFERLMTCSCGFETVLGNKMAHHAVSCKYHTCVRFNNSARSFNSSRRSTNLTKQLRQNPAANKKNIFLSLVNLESCY